MSGENIFFSIRSQAAKHRFGGVGCGVIAHTSLRGDGRLINIEGDPDHVINRGSLCAKGASLRQLAENENWLTASTETLASTQPVMNVISLIPF